LQLDKNAILYYDKHAFLFLNKPQRRLITMKLLITLILLTPFYGYATPSTTGCTTHTKPSTEQLISQSQAYQREKLFTHALVCVREGLKNQPTANEKISLLIVGVQASETGLNHSSESKNYTEVQKYLLFIQHAIQRMAQVLGKTRSGISATNTDTAKRIIEEWKHFRSTTLVLAQNPIAGIQLKLKGMVANKKKRIAINSATSLLLTTRQRSTTVVLARNKFHVGLTGSRTKTVDIRICSEKLSSNNIGTPENRNGPCIIYLENNPGLFVQQLPPPTQTAQKTPWGTILGSTAGAFLIGGLVMWIATPESVNIPPSGRGNYSVH